MAKVVHVAVGVIYDTNGNILIARRAQDAHQGGLWEFPGGKVDTGERVQDALRRELEEELAIKVKHTQPLIQIRYDYPDKSVLLDVHQVTRFSGVAHGNEGQPIRWISPSELTQYAFPAANKPIVSAILLPDKMLITGTFSSHDDFLQRLTSALDSGIRLVQFRCPDLLFQGYQQLAAQAKNLCQQYQARLIFNTTPEIFPALQGEGLHLNRHELKRCAGRPVNESILLGASCHNAEEIELARKINVDYICLSPVAETHSHPGENVLGWAAFSELAQRACVPVYALGGMQASDVETACQYGGQGIAAISCFWPS
jgi:8-oxo-dGTP diphosphatase